MYVFEEISLHDSHSFSAYPFSNHEIPIDFSLSPVRFRAIHAFLSNFRVLAFVVDSIVVRLASHIAEKQSQDKNHTPLLDIHSKIDGKGEAGEIVIMSSPSGKKETEKKLESHPDRLRDNLTCGQSGNKPEFKELHTGSPISPLRAGTLTDTTTTSSSSTSSGSFSRPASSRHSPKPPRIPDSSSKRNPGGHSEESSFSDAGKGHTRRPVSAESHSPSAAEKGHTRSASVGSHSQSSSAARKSQAGSDSVGSRPAKSFDSRSATPTNLDLPFYGNICPSGQVKTGMASRPRSTVMRSALSNVDGNSGKRIGISNHNDPVQLRRMVDDCRRRGDFAEIVRIYDKAIAIEPRNAVYHFNRSEALSNLGRLMEAAEECEETLRLRPEYFGARSRLGFLLFRLGQVENARTHYCYTEKHQDPTALQMLQKLQSVEKHLTCCSNARTADDWKSTLREVNAAIDAGADASPQLLACKAEALLKLRQLNDAFLVFSKVPDIAPTPTNRLEKRLFGMLFESYVLSVRSQIELAKGRFEDALTTIEKARQKDPHHPEISALLDKTKSVIRVRVRGNKLYSSQRFIEASAEYDEGIRLDPLNTALISNRAACWYKLGKWERSAEDCELALRLQPNHTKSLMRRAAINFKLNRWQKAVTDYKALLKEFPNDPEIVEAYFHSEVALRKSHGEDVSNMRYGGKVESVSTLAEFSAAISAISATIVHFRKASSPKCKKISKFMDILCTSYPYVNFLQVDIENASEIAETEWVNKVPMIKVYRKGKRVHDMDDPTPESLEPVVRHFHRVTFT